VYSTLGAIFGIDVLYKFTFYLLTYLLIIKMITVNNGSDDDSDNEDDTKLKCRSCVEADDVQLS